LTHHFFVDRPIATSYDELYTTLLDGSATSGKAPLTAPPLRGWRRWLTRWLL
jgi:hypothetical protein